MKIIALVLTFGMAACGVEYKESKDSRQAANSDTAKQITAKSNLPASEKLPKTLIARVKVDQQGRTVGETETRSIEGSVEQFTKDSSGVAEAFQSGEALEYRTFDGETSSNQHHSGLGRGWYFWNRGWNYPGAYFRYYYHSYSSYYYVNYSYANHYQYDGYRYYCYRPYWI